MGFLIKVAGKTDQYLDYIAPGMVLADQLCFCLVGFGVVVFCCGVNGKIN